MVDTTCRGLISKDEVEIKRLELELSKPAISIVREQKLNSRKVNYLPTWGEDLIPSNQDKEAIAINLVDSYKRFFRLEDINPTLERIIRYFISRGEEIEIHLSIPGEEVYLPIDYFLNEFSGEELYKLVIYIYSFHTDVF